MRKNWATRITSFTIGTIILLAIVTPIFQSSNINQVVTGTPTGWTDDVRLTSDTTQDVMCRIAVDDDTVHLIWEKDTTGAGGHYDIFYMNSTDAGNKWNTPIRLTNGTSGIYCRNPDLGISGSALHVVWDDNDEVGRQIKYCNSTNGGISWSSPRRLSMDDNESEGAKIAVNVDDIHVVWIDSRFFVSPDWNTEIYYVRSTDGGITWDDGLGNVGQERRLTNAIYGSGANGIVTNGSNVHMIFSDDRESPGICNVYYKRSIDNGATWDDGLGNTNQDRKLTTNGINHGPGAIAVNGSTIHVTWIDEVWPGPNYYMYYCNSTDNGATWSPIQLLVNSGTAYNPSIDVEGNEVHLTWDDWRDTGSTKEIYYKNSTDNGATWSPEIRLTAVDDNSSAGPKIALSGSYKHVTWIDQRDGNREIYYKRSPDFPPDTTPPDHTNETPPPDSYKDAPGTNISIHVTDPSGVNESSIQLWVNSSLVTHTLTPITDGYNVSWASPGFDPGVVECRIVADDNLSNTLDYTWNFTVLALYEIQLHEGWNLISVPHVQVDTAIDEVLRDIDGKWNYIQWYDASDPIDHWKTNATFKPQQLNDLFYLNRSMAFWINITEPNVNLTVRGHISTYTEIQLYAGWNLVGYSTQNIETVANALWGTGADKVEVFDPAEPYRIREVGPTYVMRPGEGYWVHVPADTVWIVDW